MKKLEVSLDERGLNLIWRALRDRELKLLRQIDESGEDSDEAALLANDVVYLRLYQAELRRKAEGIFSESAFSLDEGWLDLSKM